VNTTTNNQQNHYSQAYKMDPKDKSTINFVCRGKDSPRDRSIVRARHVGGLRKLFALRHGAHLPDNCDARKHLFALLQNLAGLQFANARTLAREIESLAPWMSETEVLDTIERVGRRLSFVVVDNSPPTRSRPIHKPDSIDWLNLSIWFCKSIECICLIFLRRRERALLLITPDVFSV